MNPVRHLILFMILPMLGACAVGPDYQPADFPVGEQWAVHSADTRSPPVQWWQRFDDPVLDTLIEQALVENHDVRIAVERIGEARAQRGQVASQGRPQASTSASVVRERQSENGPIPAGRVPGIETYQTIYDLGLDASWEIDLFGRVRRAVESADARLEARIEQVRDVQVSVAAEVARVYFQMRGAQRELVAVDAAIAASQGTFDLIQRRYATGSASLLELRKAEAELDIAKARVPPVVARRDGAALALAVLVGQLPEETYQLAESADPAVALTPVPVGTRADLLRRRPDIRRAERELAAATAEIGVAEGELYPRLVLSVGGGFTALDAGDVFDSASRRWSVLPFFSWRILDGGRVRAEIDVAESRQRQAALAYERAILSAIGESERALSSYTQSLAAISLQQAALGSVRASEALTRRQYEAGLVSLLPLLDAQRQVNEVQANAARADTEAALELVRLYKALGGGWEAPDSQALVSIDGPNPTTLLIP